MYAKLLIIPILLIGTCAGQDMNEIISSIFNTNMGVPTTTAPLTRNPGVPTTTVPLTRNPVSVPVAVPTRAPVTPTRIEQPVVDKDGHSYQVCGLGKVCVRQYLCLNGTIKRDGRAMIDVRSYYDSPCNFFETCCSIENKVDKPTIDPFETPNECGYRNENGIGIQMEGAVDNEAEYGEFPWMVAVLREEAALDRVLTIYKCGGSVLTPRVVLTGAHCVHADPANVFKVRAGEWETNSKSELYPDQDRQVVDMIVHENYNKGSLYNDIALLFLDAPFDLAPNVNTICLPPPNLNFDFERCYATGWGKDQFENGQYQNILKKIELPVVPNDQCQTNLRKTRLGRYFELHSSFMCAGGERGKDMCKGDGGSPLMCPMSNDSTRFYQVGIVAWGIGCGGENVPGVYANVPYLRPWIDKQLADRQIDSSYYTA